MEVLVESMSLQPNYQRIIRIVITLLIALSLSLAIAWGSQYAARSTTNSLAQEAPKNWVAYDVDYEMDQARVEKTIEHYGEQMKPIVEQAIKNNEENPESKATAENSYEREGLLNEQLPESVGETFSKKELVEMDK